MKNIDFLPERYYERALKRKAAIWQYALLLGFGGVLLAATLGQFAIKQSLRASLAELEPALDDTRSKRDQVASLRQQLGNTEEIAALYTYLRHPWPRTQLLAKITESLPECVILEGVEILEQEPNGPAFANNETSDAASGATPAIVDLAHLRGNHDQAKLVLRIRGTVDETAALNDYVRQLSSIPLFRSVSLSSLQSQTKQGEATRSSFELNVIVRPGHGQAGGPDEPLAKRDHVAQYSLGRRPQ